MKTFSKYELNVMKAKAVQEIANQLGYYREGVEESLESYKEQLKKEMGESEVCEWRITSLEDSIEECGSKLAALQKVFNYIDKEFIYG